MYALRDLEVMGHHVKKENPDVGGSIPEVQAVLFFSVRQRYATISN